MIELLHGVAVALYGAAAVWLGLAFARGERRLPRGATAVFVAGLLVHAGGLAAYADRWDQLPLAGLGPALSTLALLIGVGALAAAASGGAGPLELILVPVVALLVGTAAGVGIRPAAEPTVFRGPWLAFHVVLAFVGYAGLTVAFAAGLMYLLQFRELKSKRFGAIFRFFPPLDTLDRVGRRALLAGFPALSLALILGWAWTASFQRSLALRNPQVIWGVLTWIVFVVALTARAGGGHQGRRAALASVIGFAVVVLAYLALRAGTSQGGSFL